MSRGQALEPRGRKRPRGWVLRGVHGLGIDAAPGPEGGGARLSGARGAWAPRGEGPSDRVAGADTPLGTRVSSSEVRAGPLSWDSWFSGWGVEWTGECWVSLGDS